MAPACKISTNHQIDFAYSTICLQHICVHDIRHEIFKDIFSLLGHGGRACFQMACNYNPSGGALWFDNNYDAPGTNAGADVHIPDASHFEEIKTDLETIGYEDVSFEIKESPHPKLRKYHPNWLFIHCGR